MSARHGVIEYDDQEEWLVESDPEGASRVIATRVPRWFGLLVVERLSGSSPAPVGEQREPLDAAWKAAEAALPPGCVLYGVTRSNLGTKQDWRAAYEDAGGWFNFYGPTPAAALQVLAAKLRAIPSPDPRSET
jgi:hypothetical protein